MALVLSLVLVLVLHVAGVASRGVLSGPGCGCRRTGSQRPGRSRRHRARCSCRGQLDKDEVLVVGAGSRGRRVSGLVSWTRLHFIEAGDQSATTVQQAVVQTGWRGGPAAGGSTRQQWVAAGHDEKRRVSITRCPGDDIVQQDLAHLLPGCRAVRRRVSITRCPGVERQTGLEASCGVSSSRWCSRRYSTAARLPRRVRPGMMSSRPITVVKGGWPSVSGLTVSWVGWPSSVGARSLPGAGGHSSVPRRRCPHYMCR